MKIFFSIMLIFLFLSCSGGSKAPVDDDSAAVLPDEDEDILDDEEFVDEDDDDEPYTKPDKDSDKPGDDEDVKTDPCRPGYCWDVGGTGVCFPSDDEYGFTCVCRDHRTWTGTYCRQDINEVECTGLPEHAHWSVSPICEQTWQEPFNGEAGWYPSPEARYGRSQEAECYFLCDENYFWNGSECVNLCESEPCKDVPHSDGVCSSVGATLFTCGCEDGYYWWGERRGCTTQKPALGNICSGQSECYDNSSEIECPLDPDEAFYGQEAYYAKLGTCSPLDITVDSSNPDEPLIINRNTGLMWQQKITEESYTWENAIAHCENLTYAGYDDWRLPSVKELMSIIVSSGYMVEYNMTFFNFFPEHADYADRFRFWTSNWAVYAYEYAWYLTFYNNKIEAYKATDTNLAMCVRGEELPEGEFEVSEINGNAVVTDSTTGLMWQQVPGKATVWKQALYYCEHLVYAGYSDWRLPNRSEILSLINYDKAYPASDFPGIYSSSDVYSSTTTFYGIGAKGIMTGSGMVFIPYLSYGYVLVSSKANTSVYYDDPVYCVRSDICPHGQFLRGLECLDDPCSTASCEVSNSTGECVPKTETDYECKCLEGYFWNGSECVDPCETNPCATIANAKSYGCTAVNSSLYLCECADGYVWNNGKCDTYATNVKTIGNICTGQGACYDDKYSIECFDMANKAFFGQDGYNAILGTCIKQDLSVKTVGEENIIVDNNTKLEWQQSYSKKQVNWYDAYAYCDSLEYGGKSDWRLPAPHELLTIVDIGGKSGMWTMLNMDYFSEVTENPTDGRNFWADNGWLLDPREGWTISYPKKEDLYFVMCVRGKTLPKANLEELTIKGDKIVRDSSTGLSWTINTFSTEKWSEALSYCLKLQHAGYSDWRLPNKNELASLIGFDKNSVPGFDGCSWSSTTYQYRGEYFIDVSTYGKFDYRLKNWDDYQGSGSSISVICVGNMN